MINCRKVAQKRPHIHTVKLRRTLSLPWKEEEDEEGATEREYNTEGDGHLLQVPPPPPLPPPSPTMLLRLQNLQQYGPSYGRKSLRLRLRLQPLLVPGTNQLHQPPNLRNQTPFQESQWYPLLEFLQELVSLANPRPLF